MEVIRSIRETPRRVVDAWTDPVRRRNSIARIIETALPSGAVLALLGAFWATPVVVLGEFLLYEWVLEPLGLTGYYWERGPRDGETFRRP